MNPMKSRPKGEDREKMKMKKKKKIKALGGFKSQDMSKADKYSLCDAMRYLRAFEAGRAPTSVKYDVAVRIKTPKNSLVIRNRLRLPHPVKTDLRVCVICPPDSIYAQKAREAGAVLVGEDEIFEQIKDGKIEFDRCVCQSDSMEKLTKAGVARILGPRGLMPSAKLGTVMKDPAQSIQDMVTGAEYREREGVIRMAIGQLALTPQQLSQNIRTFMTQLKREMAQMSDRVQKDLAEVVLSSTNGPGFTLSGEFKKPTSPIAELSLPN